ncbi:MAG TPA: hypothetical protein VH255_03025 [Verrucomicrobiae bacterium]|nr:hypothetical protein [Verrucomicrobiae bacterium]
MLASFLTGCTTIKVQQVGSSSTKPTVADNGYALLYDLMGNEKDVSKLSIIKHEHEDFHTLISDISKRCGEAYDQMTALGKADASLKLTNTGLPLAETLTRKHEGSARGKQLLLTRGKNLELQLILTQNEALTYATHLSAVLAENDTNTQRVQFAKQLNADITVLESRVNGMLSTNYMWVK